MNNVLREVGIETEGAIRDYFLNLHPNNLIEKAIQGHEGKFAKGGGIILPTGKSVECTEKFRYVVREDATEKTVHWTNQTRSLTRDNFDRLKESVLQHLNEDNDIYVTYKKAGNPLGLSADLVFVSTSSLNTLFVENTYFENTELSNAELALKIYHCPKMMFDPNEFEVEAEITVAFDFEQRTCLIIGTPFSGEIKKAISSLLNYTLMNRDEMFFSGGLFQDLKSGITSLLIGGRESGKSILPIGANRAVVGDDEYLYLDGEFFGVTKGAYVLLSEKDYEENQTLKNLTENFGTILENVTLNENNRRPKLSKEHFGVYQRASFSLDEIDRFQMRYRDSLKTVNNIVLLVKDAYGVLPALAELSKAQLLQFYQAGYSTKLEKSEDDMIIPSAIFYPGFDSLSQMENPEARTQKFERFLANENNARYWLMNTGWIGELGNGGSRISLELSQKLVRCLGQKNISFSTRNCDVFGFKIVDGIEGELIENLVPKITWKDEEKFLRVSKGLLAHISDKAKTVGVNELTEHFNA